jgi:hypothetical protein
MEEVMNVCYEKFKVRYPVICDIIGINNQYDLTNALLDELINFKYDTGLQEYLSKSDYANLNKGVKVDKACFITIAPSKYRTPIPYTEENINILKNFGENIGFLYKNYLYVVESGKYVDTPHLHIHILGIMRNSKKHLAQLRAKWEQLTGFTIDWKSDDYDCKQHRNSDAMPNYNAWLNEKISYMTDEYKGTHKNFEILMTEPGGSGGF